MLTHLLVLHGEEQHRIQARDDGRGQRRNINGHTLERERDRAVQCKINGTLERKMGKVVSVSGSKVENKGESCQRQIQ